MSVTSEQRPRTVRGPGVSAPWSSGARQPSLALEVLAAVGVAVALGYLLVFVGLVMVIISYFRVSGTPTLQKQLAYFASGSVGGLAVLGVGALLILSYHYRESARSNADLREALLQGGLFSSGVTSQFPGASVQDRGNGQLVVRAGRQASFHRPDCVFVTDKPSTTNLTVPEAMEEGLRPCGVCAPTEPG